MSANYTPNQNEYKNLTPFKCWLLHQINNWGLSNFPFVESDFDELTNYGMLMKMMKALNDVISNQNEVEQDMTNLFGAFTELQSYVNNYFDDLNLQEEVDNKLDDMVESGQLQEIIADYLNSKAVFGFDNIASMKSAENLIDGSYAKTLGYYSIDDGGSALYKIVEEPPVNEYYETLENGLYACLIIENNELNLKQIGLKDNDNTFDNGSLINTNINFIKLHNVLIPNGNYYFSTSINLLNLPDNFKFKCTGNLIYTGNSNAINLNGENIELYIDTLKTNYSSYKNIPSGTNLIGLNVISLVKSNIDVHNIIGFTKGYNIIGDGTNLYEFDGTIYNDFKSYYIDSYIGVYISKNYGYVNENTFELGWIDAYDGIKFEDNNTWSDAFNNNRFINIGFENIEHNGIILDNCRRCLMSGCRFENAENLFIEEKSNSAYNMYLINYSTFSNKISLNGTRRIMLGSTMDANGDVNTQMNLTGYNSTPVHINSVYNASMPNNTIYFENDNGVIFDKNFCRVKKSDGTTGIVPFQDHTSNGTLRVVNADANIDRNIHFVYAASTNTSVNIITNADMQQNGHYFFISSRYYTNPIVVKKASGAVGVSDIGGTGTFMIMYINDNWQKIKISDEYFTM